MRDLTFTGILRADLPDVLAIESLSFDRPLTERRLTNWLRWPLCPQLGLVATRGNAFGGSREVVAYALYSVLPEQRVHLARLAVHPTVRRRGVGRRLFGEVCRRAAVLHCSPQLSFRVRETDLTALCFVRACGVPPTGLTRGHYRDGADAVRFTIPYPGLDAVAECGRRAA